MRLLLAGAAISSGGIWGAPELNQLVEVSAPLPGAVGGVSQPGSTLHFINSDQYPAMTVGTDGASLSFPIVNSPGDIADRQSTDGEQALIYPQPLAAPAPLSTASPVNAVYEVTQSATAAPSSPPTSTEKPDYISQSTVASDFVWSTANVAAAEVLDSLPIAPHLQAPIDIATTFTSGHVGFEAPETGSDFETWNTSQSAADLIYDLESRLQRAQSSPVPGQSGYLPVEYFDEPIPPPAATPWSVPRDSYVPYVVTDEELLAEQSIALSPYVQMPKEVTMYCYPFGEEEINGKCLTAMEDFGATAVYLPMMAEIGTERSKSYYDAIRQLKKTLRKDGKRYQIIGVAYDNPNWALITQVVMRHPLFDGVLIEWVGNNACIWNIHQPTRGQVDTILEMAGPIYYFFRNQECEDELTLNSPYGAAFVNPNEDVDVSDIQVIRGQFPHFLTPIFPCFQGQEGPCYNAFRYYTQDACSSKQKFAFSPYEPLGGLMMHFANETCHGMPEHDLYSVV